jgi:hypothetical protein
MYLILNDTSLRYTTCGDMYVCYKMFITIKLLAHPSYITVLFVWWEHLRSLLSEFQVYNTVLLTIVTISMQGL